MFGSVIRYVEQYNGVANTHRTIDGLAREYRGRVFKPKAVIVELTDAEAKIAYEEYAAQSYPDIPFRIHLVQ